MNNLIYGNKFKLIKRCGISFLILAHLLLVTPLPEAQAMESANYKIKENAVSSGGGKSSAVDAEIPYSNVGEPAVGNMESANFKVALGYLNTIASNPPVLTQDLPDADMRLIWEKGEDLSDPFDLDAYFRSPDRSLITYTVEGNFNIDVEIDPDTYSVSFSQDPDFSGSESVRFIARDEEGNITKSNVVFLIVKAPENNAPIIYPIDDVVCDEEDVVSVEPRVFDPDGDTLTRSFTAPLDDNGAWETSFEDAGTYNVTASVSDGQYSDSEVFNLEVKNVNRPPIVEPIPDITADEGDLIKLRITAYDPDGDNITISYPEPFEDDGTWQAFYKDAGFYSLSVTVSDGDLVISEEFNITINNVNGSPIVEISADRYDVSIDEVFIVSIIAEDPDGDALQLTLKKDGVPIPGCEDILLGTNLFTKTLSISDKGNHTIESYIEEVDVPGVPNTASAFMSMDVREGSAPDENFPISGDFNGDGLTDLGYYNRELGIWKVSLSNGTSFGASEIWIDGAEDFGRNDTFYYPVISDFNGDGKTDAGFIKVPTGYGGLSYIDIAVSSGTGFDIYVPDGRDHWLESTDGNMSQFWKFTTFTGDFNGDGISDVGQIRIDTTRELYIGITGEDLETNSLDHWVPRESNHDSIDDNYATFAGDYNGDGFSDLCLFGKDEGQWAVILSRGNRFVHLKDWQTGFGTDKDVVIGDFNFDGKTDIGYLSKGEKFWRIKFAFSNGKDGFVESDETYNTEISQRVEGTFITGDFNGDGLFDVAVFNKETCEWVVRLHHSKYPDLLVGIDNGVGGKTHIQYKDSVIFDNTGEGDGSPDLPFSVRVVTEVTQSDGLGRKYKTKYSYANGLFETDKREFRGFGFVSVTGPEGNVKETYFNQDNLFKGRPRREVVKDKYGRTYAEVSFNWRNRKLHNDLVDFPYLLDKSQTAYNPDTSETKSSQTFYEYDDYGNIENTREEGFLDVVGDEKEVSIDYLYNTDDWILSKPLETRIKDAAGVTVSATRYYYDPSGNGALRKEEKWLGEVGEEPEWGVPVNPTTEFIYDDTGNIKVVVNSRRCATFTNYDITKTFPISVTNHINHLQRFTYNKATGKILTSTDPNSQKTISEYDGFGRLKRVVGPGNISEVSYTYDLETFPARITTSTCYSRANGNSEFITAYGFVDGLGRQILSRVQAEQGGAPKHIVSGEVEYDSRGQVIKKYLPYYIDVPDSEGVYLPPALNTPFMFYEYDAMGRVLKTVRPDNKASYVIYDLDKVEAINEKGQRAKQTKDAYGQIIEVEEDNGNLTNYRYDALGNLTDTYDSSLPRNHVQMEYDTLGRKTSMTDPDMGGFAGKSWRYRYDKVGNLVEQIDAKGQKVIFEYDQINRLERKSTGVTYTYDQGENRIGRLSWVDDQTGRTEFFYDILGREEKTIKTIGSVSYMVERTYDSLDRLVTVTYPDTSVVKYHYNIQGGIGSVTDGTGSVIYVANVDYNANGQIMRIEYGNGTSTDYEYDPYNFRLERLNTYNLQLTTIQDLSYNFDPIGNVKSIIDPIHSNTQFFEYDNINRLTRANGASYGAIDYEYDSVGNMLQKGDLTMEYGNGAGPHAVTSYQLSAISYQLSYDDNGNMTRKDRKTFEYDIENRLVKVTEPRIGDDYEISTELKIGWNFISIPGIVPGVGFKAEDIFSSIDGKYEQISKYAPETGEWLHYVGIDKFNQFDTLEYGEGCLIYVTEACTLNVRGNFPPTPQTKDLKTGWNLINAPTDTTIDVTEALAGVDYTSLRGADVVGDEAIYNEVTTMQSGKAYWVHVPNDQTWLIPIPSKETTYLYDGDGGRVMRTEPTTQPSPQGGEGTGGETSTQPSPQRGEGTGEGETRATVYIGAAYELSGVPGQPATKITKHIFMGSTRICSIETEDEVEHTYYYHPDHLGSSNVITNETGDIASIIEYTPYGLTASTDGTYNTDKRFTGKTYDAGSALYYYGARYYDPQLGRFITADSTIAHPNDPQDFNRYAYCRNNPVKYVDPTGHFWNLIIGAIIGAIVGAITALVTGQNVWIGMATGAVAGAIFAYVGYLDLGGLAQIGAHMVAGASSGAINATITGSDAGMSALIGGASAGVSAGLGSMLPSASGNSFNAYLANVTKRAVIGGVVGGSTSAALGGNFWEGVKQGAMTSAIAYTANDVLHSTFDKATDPNGESGNSNASRNGKLGKGNNPDINSSTMTKAEFRSYYNRNNFKALLVNKAKILTKTFFSKSRTTVTTVRAAIKNYVKEWYSALRAAISTDPDPGQGVGGGLGSGGMEMYGGMGSRFKFWMGP